MDTRRARSRLCRLCVRRNSTSRPLGREKGSVRRSSILNWVVLGRCVAAHRVRTGRCEKTSGGNSSTKSLVCNSTSSDLGLN
jgi:hypothetical protein